MERWEYFVARALVTADYTMIDEVTALTLVEALNELGRDGWELVSVAFPPVDGDWVASRFNPDLYFKRRLS